jgi:hypothetical protein
MYDEDDDDIIKEWKISDKRLSVHQYFIRRSMISSL